MHAPVKLWSARFNQQGSGTQSPQAMLPVGKTARALARANILVRDHEGPRLVEVKALTSVKNVHIGEVLGEWVGVA